MKAKDSVVRARINSTVKSEAEDILQQMGLSTSDAIQMLFNMIVLHKGIPFEVKIPNKETLETFRKTNAGEELEEFDTPEDLEKAIDTW